MENPVAYTAFSSIPPAEQDIGVFPDRVIILCGNPAVIPKKIKLILTEFICF